MINSELLSKFDRIQDLPISEELLGAYMEGNVSEQEQLLVSSIANSSSEISSLLCAMEDFNVEELADCFHEFNQIDIITSADQELPEIDSYVLSQDCCATSVDIETIGAELSDFFDNNLLENHIASNNHPVEDENIYLTGDSSEQDAYSLDTDSVVNSDTDFESENNNFNNLDFLL